MKKKVLSMTMLAMVSWMGKTAAQSPATATANVSATIAAPVSLLRITGSLSFGAIAPSGTAGAVTLAPNGTRSFTGGVSALPGPGAINAAVFQVTGESGYSYAITLPVSVPMVNTTSGGNEVLLATHFVSNPSGTGVLTGGVQTLLVGATLQMTAQAVPGVYSTATPFTVTVNYN